MPDERLSGVTFERLRDCWALHIGIPPADLFASETHVLTYGPEHADYNGVLYLFDVR